MITGSPGSAGIRRSMILRILIEMENGREKKINVVSLNPVLEDYLAGFHKQGAAGAGTARRAGPGLQRIFTRHGTKQRPGK
ncbi:hypothetical protein [Desulfotomaculum copahuensis]|uniref:Uncharacterized protein n=1 Tax=Desulfotomaculum copahuensis TaxID=1838280 RepID=A0A1B7LGI6_9FIRM|nr:hypothetical protein [Desulfotomaculum copahuensis]OAT85101.1 hypothetical protein A6M21_07070 [Desulfotomaculum copahuensis]